VNSMLRTTIGYSAWGRSPYQVTVSGRAGVSSDVVGCTMISPTVVRVEEVLLRRLGRLLHLNRHLRSDGSQFLRPSGKVPLMVLTPMQRLRIRARSGVADESLRNYLEDPASVRDATRMRIEEAARAEGIALPGRAPSTPPTRAT
jgi:hypothetical protein